MESRTSTCSDTSSITSVNASKQNEAQSMARLFDFANSLPNLTSAKKLQSDYFQKWPHTTMRNRRPSANTKSFGEMFRTATAIKLKKWIVSIDKSAQDQEQNQDVVVPEVAEVPVQDLTPAATKKSILALRCRLDAEKKKLDAKRMEFDAKKMEFDAISADIGRKVNILRDSSSIASSESTKKFARLKKEVATLKTLNRKAFHEIYKATAAELYSCEQDLEEWDETEGEFAALVNRLRQRIDCPVDK